MRINARLDDEAARQITYLIAATGQSVSHVVREAIAVYHAQLRRQQPRPKSKFLALVGKGHSGRSDIASNVREHIGEILEAKHGLSPRPRSR